MKTPATSRLNRTMTRFGRSLLHMMPESLLVLSYGRMLERAVEMNRELVERLASQPASNDTKAPGPSARGLLATLGSSFEAKLDLYCFPPVELNPYLDLLYADCAKHGIRVHPLRSLDDLPDPRTSVVHLHWTTRLHAGTATPEAAATRSASAINALRAYSQAGGKILWSLHEPMPHESPFPEIERRFREELAELADAIHVMHADTADVVRPLYSIDDTMHLVVPMPSYDGVYANTVTRDQARARLGFGEEFVLLAFGAIRPYKHFDRAIDAVDALIVSGVPAKLIIAGPTWDAVDNATLFSRAAASEHVVIYPDVVPNDEVQYLFKAADLVVLPYTDFLNSAVLAVGQAFQTPVVIPANPTTLDAASRGGVYLYDDPAQFVETVVSIAHRECDPAGLSEPRPPSESLSQALVRLGWVGGSG